MRLVGVWLDQLQEVQLLCYLSLFGLALKLRQRANTSKLANLPALEEHEEQRHFWVIATVLSN